MAPRPNQGLSKTLGATVTEDEYEAFQALAEGRGGASKALRSLVRAELHAGAPVTVGEYLKARYQARKGDRAAQLLLRTVAETGTGDSAGLFPVSVVGEVVRFVDDSRPMVSSFRRLPLPAAGTQILRPKAIQRTTDAKQTEKAQLSSTQFQASSVAVSKAKYGGVINITEQDLDWSTPDELQTAVEDMASSYAVQTEAANRDGYRRCNHDKRRDLRIVHRPVSAYPGHHRRHHCRTRNVQTAT